MKKLNPNDDGRPWWRSVRWPRAAPTRTTRSAGEDIDDATLTAKVKTAITREPTSNAVKVDVETYRGDVQLNGFVETAQT